MRENNEKSVKKLPEKQNNYVKQGLFNVSINSYVV